MTQVLKLYQNIVTLLLISLGLLLIFINLYFYSYTYQEITTSIYQTHENVIDIQHLETRYFTPTRFLTTRYIVLGLGVLYLLILLFFWKRIHHILAYNLQGFLHSLFRLFYKINYIFRNLSRTETRILFLVLLLSLLQKLYYIFQFPIMIDEMYSYMFMIRPGYATVLTYYPDTNNHIFFNLIAKTFDLVFNDIFWSMRLPSLLAYFLLLLLIFAFLKRYFSFQVAILAVILSSFLAPSGFYSMQGRGHLFIDLLSFIHLFAFWFWYRYRERFYANIFIISGSLAFYTAPIFLYLWVSVGFWALYLLRKEPRSILKLIYFELILGGLVFVFYMPVFLGSGMDKFFMSQHYKRQEIIYFFTYILPIASAEALDYIVGTPKYAYYLIGFLIIPTFYVWYQKRKNIVLHHFFSFAILSILAFLLVISLMRIFPFYRLLTIYVFIFHFILAIVLGYFLGMLRQKLQVFMSIIFALLMLFFAYFQYEKPLQADTIPFSKPLYQKFHQNMGEILESKPKHIFCNSNYYACFLWHKVKTENLEIDLDNYQYNVHKDYTYVIIGEIYGKPQEVDLSQYQKVYEILSAEVYRKIE